LTSLVHSHSVITVHTFDYFWVPNPSLLSASCISGVLEFSRILVLLLPTSVCCRILSSLLHFSVLLYSTFGWSRRHLLERSCFAFSMQRSPAYWLPRELKRFGIRYLGNCYSKLRPVGGAIVAFRRLVTIYSTLYDRE
jgi:hypothetical protein